MATSVAKLAIQLTIAGANTTLGAFRGVVDGARGIHGALSTANQQLFYFLGNMRSIGSAVAGGVGAFIGPQFEFEKMTEQLAFVLGSQEAAIEKQKELFSIGNEVGFGTTPMTQMFLNLERVGRGALTSEDQLRLWVRAAKLSGQEAGSMAQQIADLWAVLQSGEDPTRMMKGFLTSGLISPTSFKSISGMIDSKNSPSSIFAALTEAMSSRTSGMDDVPQTMDDTVTALRNYGTEAKRLLSLGLFAALRTDAESLQATLRDAFDSGKVEAWATSAGESVRGVYEKLKTMSFGGVTGSDLGAAFEQGKLAELIGEMLQTAGSNFWQFMVFQARVHGPAIQRALIPDRLHRALGIAEDSSGSSLMGQVARSVGGGPIFDLNSRLLMGPGGKGAPSFNAQGVDPDLLHQLRNADILPALNSISPMILQLNEAGLAFSGFRHIGADGKETFFDSTEVRDFLGKLGVAGDRIEAAAKLLEAGAYKQARF